MNYRAELELKTTEDIKKILSSLPPYVDDYIRDIQFTTTPQTRLGYLRDLSLFFEYVIDADTNYEHKDKKEVSLKCLEGLSLNFFNSYLDYLSFYEKNGVIRKNGRNSIGRKLSSLKNFYSYLFLNDLIGVNILQKVKTPKVAKKEIIRMDMEESKQFISTVEYGIGNLSLKEQQYFDKYSLRDFTIISLLLNTGIRVSELVGLDIKDVEMKHSCIKIIRKGGKEDIVYYNDSLNGVLEDYIGYRKNLESLEGYENALFLSSQKRRITVRSVENLVKKYSGRTEILRKEKISPHKLRSTFGTALYEKTGDIFLVAETLGHSSVQTTSKHYTELSKQRKYSHRNSVDFLADDDSNNS